MGQTQSQSSIVVQEASDASIGPGVSVSHALYEKVKAGELKAELGVDAQEESNPDKMVLASAYQKGYNDCKKAVEERIALDRAQEKAKYLRQLQDIERKQQEHAQHMIQSLGGRALKDVKSSIPCSTEKEAVLACYRNVDSSSVGSSIACKSVAQAFVECSAVAKEQLKR